MISKIKKYFSEYTKPELILLLIVIIQITYLMLFNIFKTKSIINFDSSEYLVQVIQIWKQKTILIEDYYYSTMLTWDMPTLIAVLFYGIFHDVFLAYGLANNVLIIVFALVLNKLCNDLNYSKGAKWLVFLAIFTVYQYGAVDYIEELFVNGSLYGFRILFMLILVDVLICLKKDKLSKMDILLYGICVVGCYVCGISSGVFELGCCILPIVLFAFWDVLGQEKRIAIRDFFQLKTILPVVAAVFCVLGVVTNYLLGFSGSSAADKTTIAASEMANNIAGVLMSFFQLFGWSDSNIVLTSIGGITQLVAFVAAAVVILVFFMATRLCVKKNELTENIIQRDYGQIVLCVFIVNTLLFFLADLTYGSKLFEYRYWLMVVIPVFVEIGIVYDWMKRCFYNYWVVLVTLYVLLLCAICGYKDTKLWNVYNCANFYETYMNIADENDVNHLYIYGDFFSSRICSSFAKEDMEVYAISNEGATDDGQGWYTNQLRMPRWGTYVKDDTDCLDVKEDKTFAVMVQYCIGDDWNYLTSKAKEVYTQEYCEYQLLLMDKNYIDFIYGMPVSGSTHSRDFFNWGYSRYDLSLNEEGYYQTNINGGTKLEGKFVASESGVFSATLQYELISANQATPAMFSIVVKNQLGEVVEYSQEIKQGQTEVMIDNINLNQGDEYSVYIETEDGTILSLEQIDYYRNN